jgi:hypothetical protein
VTADQNPVAVGERDASTDSTALSVNGIGGAQIGDDEAGAGVADHGVVAAYFRVVEHDVVIGEPADPSRIPVNG